MFRFRRWAHQCTALMLASCAGLFAQKPAPYQLVMKSSVPACRQVDVLYSPDGHYAAVSGDSEIYVYNLSSENEVFRANVASPFLSFAAGLGYLAFDAASAHFYLKNNFSLIDCTPGSVQTKCTTLSKDVATSFRLADTGKIAYVNLDNLPTVIDPRNPSNPNHLANTVPAADEDDFTWATIDINLASGQHPRLTLTGNIDRHTKVPASGGRTRIVTRKEWRASVFDLTTGSALVSYRTIPVDAGSTALTASGHTILCGQDQDEEDRLSARSDDPPEAATRFFDLNTSRYLAASEQSSIPASFRKSCLAGPRPLSAAFLNNPNLQAGNAPADLPSGWKSPKGDLEITTGTTDQGAQALYLKHLTAPITTDVLAGTTDLLNRVGFVPPASVVANGLTSTHVFDFGSGTVQSVGVNVRYAPGKRNAFFAIDPNTKRWTLTFLNSDMKLTPAGLSLRTPPSWFALSGDGSLVAYETRTDLSLLANGVSTKLECSNPADFSSIASSSRGPVMDPSGSSLGAFCGREADDPTSGGPEPFFIVWDLRSGKEKARIPAAGFDQAGSIGWDNAKVVIGGKRGLKVADVNRDRSSDVLIKVTTNNGSLSSIRLQANAPNAILATIGTLTRSGTLTWVDLTTGKIIDHVSSPQSIVDFSVDSAGYVAALRSDNIVNVYGPDRKRMVQLIAVGSEDWLVFSEEGLFDGSAKALEWAGFRTAEDASLLTAKLFFNELYTPGLLALIARGAAPHPPSGVSLSTYRDLPGLKFMLQNGDVVPNLKFGKAGVCVTRAELFSVLSAGGLEAERTADPECPRRIILSDQSDPPALFAGMKTLLASRPATPWDGIKMPGATGAVHLMNVAVSKYSQPNLPDIPTAVPSSRAVRQALTAHAAAESVVDWNKTGCGPLENELAVKSAILGCLEKMALAVKPSDMVVLTFAGHGGTPGQSELFYYYPHSAGNQVETISAAELADFMRKLAARRIVLIVDACDSGAVAPPLQQAIVARAVMAASLPRPTSGSAPPDLQGVLLIAAASGLEPAKSGNQTNPFLEKLVNLLSSEGLSSYALAAEMQKPFVFTTERGVTSRLQFFASALGADFQITKSIRK